MEVQIPAPQLHLEVAKNQHLVSQCYMRGAIMVGIPCGYMIKQHALTLTIQNSQIGA